MCYLEKVVDEVHSLGANVGPGVRRLMLIDRYCVMIDILCYLEKVVDEVHSLGANVGPGVGRVHEVGVLDLLVDILVLVEGKHAWVD